MKRESAKRKRQFGFVVPAASGVLAGAVTAASGAAGFAPPPVMRSRSA